MALLGDPDVLDPAVEVEERWQLSGFSWTKEQRTVSVGALRWRMDATGGCYAAVPSTYDFDGVTHTLQRTVPDRGYNKRLGTYTAYYRAESAWAVPV